jgi:hypothetical protein
MELAHVGGMVMARAISDQLVRALKTVDRPGSFCASGSGPAPLPGLEVAGLGPVGLPLTTAQVPDLKNHCRQAPYGKGEETIVDTRVRRVWQLEPDKFALTNSDWQRYLSTTVEAVQRELGLEQQKLESHLYNLLLYEPGSFFLPHRDGEKLDRMVATLVVVLPSAFQGGELVVRHEGQERVIDFGTPNRNPFHTHFAAFYADCEHEVRPLREGYRLCLVYNLTLAKAKKAITAPRTAERIDAVANILRSWSAIDPLKLAVPLEHRYTQDGLVWDALKGADRARAKILADAAGRAECLAYLALLTLHESGAAEESYAPRHRRRWVYDDEDENDPDNYEMGEAFESSLTAEQWSDAAGNRPAFGQMEVGRGEVVPPQALTKVKPDVDVSGYTGNEGLTLNRWYRHAVIVLWPAAHQFDVLCDCGLPGAVAALGEWVVRWQKANRADAPRLKEQCVEFAGKIIERWGAGLGYRSPHLGGVLMALVVQIDDPQLIGTFLGRVVARDSTVDPDESLVGVFDKHGWDTFQAALTSVFEGTTAETLARNMRLLDRLCSAKSRPKGERFAVCAVLAQKATTALDALDRGEDAELRWRWREADRAEILTGLTRALIATEQFDLLSELVTRTLAASKTYPLATHVASLTALGPWLKKHLKQPSEVLAKWLAACCEQLESLTAEEPVAPADFRREAKVSCDCADCKELKTFLNDPTAKVHRFRVRQDRRQHLERNSYGCDMNCVTDRSGSPQTLVCTKNTASFEAKLKKYREDLGHLAALRSIRARLPE